MSKSLVYFEIPDKKIVYSHTPYYLHNFSRYFPYFFCISLFPYLVRIFFQISNAEKIRNNLEIWRSEGAGKWLYIAIGLIIIIS